VDRSIALAVDVDADSVRVSEILTTTHGQRAFWTADCDVTADHARFGFPGVPVGLETAVMVEAGKLVRMRVLSGFPFWTDSTWEWELDQPAGPSTARRCCSVTTDSAPATPRSTWPTRPRPGH
jgi:hypothetical protein